jgi:hypothetical protein
MTPLPPVCHVEVAFDWTTARLFIASVFSNKIRRPLSVHLRHRRK